MYKNVKIHLNFKENQGFPYTYIKCLASIFAALPPITAE